MWTNVARNISFTHTHTPTSPLNTAVVSSGSAIQETLATEQEIFRDDSSPFSHLGDMPVDQAKPSLSEMPLMARRITAPVEDQDWCGYANPSLTSNYCKYIIAQIHRQVICTHAACFYTHIETPSECHLLVTNIIAPDMNSHPPSIMHLWTIASVKSYAQIVSHAVVWIGFQSSRAFLNNVKV